MGRGNKEQRHVGDHNENERQAVSVSVPCHHLMWVETLQVALSRMHNEVLHPPSLRHPSDKLAQLFIAIALIHAQAALHIDGGAGSSHSPTCMQHISSMRWVGQTPCGVHKCIDVYAML